MNDKASGRAGTAQPAPAPGAEVPGVDPATKGETPVLAAVGLTKHFPVGGVRGRGEFVHAVDDVNLELYAGQVLALVGESGSGKSTVARLLSRLYLQTAGDVLHHGVPVAAAKGRAFRAFCRSAQMIFQDPFASLNPVHRVRYVLTRALRIHHRGLRGADLETALRALLERVQLNPDRYIDAFPHELSGGQRQRVAIARALAAEPEALLADEPISMLDVSIRIGILNLLKDLRDRLGIAILYITHDIASARYFADRTCVMYAGRIVETGDSESVTQRPAHPYTQLLVRSAPDPEHLGSPQPTGAGGEPPTMVRPPAGCRFHPRCPFAAEACRTLTPALTPIGGGREVACWGYVPRDSDRVDRLPSGLALPDLGDAAVHPVDATEVSR